MSLAFLRKFLLTALGCSFPAAAMAADNIEWVSVNLPASGGAGTVLQFSAVVKNTGDTTWDGNCYLELKDATTGTPIDYPSVAGVAPGQTVSRMFLLYLPAATGNRSYTFKGMRHNVAYFGPTQTRTINVQPGPVNQGVNLTAVPPATQEAGGVFVIDPAAMPTISTADSLGAPYRLRAKVIDGTQYGWHLSENVWSTSSFVLDNPIPVPGYYPVTSLYWVKYDPLWGTLMEIGQERFVPVRAPGGVVALTSYAFGHLSAPTIYTTQPFAGTYWLYAKFKNGSGQEWDVTPRPPNAPVDSHNNYHTLNSQLLPPPGDYSLEMTWKRWDAAGNVVGIGPTFTKPLVVIYPGAGQVLSASDNIEWDGGDYTSREHTFEVGINGTVEITVSGSFSVTTAVDRLNANDEREWVAGGGANFSFGVSAGQRFILRVGSSGGTGSYQATGMLTTTQSAPSFASPTLVLNGSVNAPFSQFVGASGSGTVSHALASGSLPPGLSLTASGHIVGTPTTPGAWAFGVRASNAVGDALRDVTIALGIAPMIVTQPADQQAAIGAQVQLTVAAAGTAPLAYVWKKNGAPISAGSGISGFNSATLTIGSFAASHAGTYEVVVSNFLGSVTSAPAVLAVGIPAPRAYAAEQITSSRFLASWSAVPGATGYRLDVSANSTFTNLVLSNHSPVYVFNGQTSIATSHTVTGLTANTDYWYRVRAVTAAGTSPNSDVIPVRTAVATTGAASLWFDKPRDVQVKGTWTKVYDGLKDEIIPAGGTHGLTYYVLDYRYTGGDITFYNYDFPTNDWWSPRNVGFDFNGDGTVDETRPAFTPLWQNGITFSYTGEIYQRIGVEFDPEPGYVYEICYSQNDTITPESLSVVNGGGPIYADNANRLIFALFNEFTIAELNRGSLYLVRYVQPPSGVVLNIPDIGSVTMSKGGATGTITLPDGTKITSNGSFASIRLPNGTTVATDGNGNSSLNLPNGISITAGPGGGSVSLPGGIGVTVNGSNIGLSVPAGASTVIGNAIDSIGKLLGLGGAEIRGQVIPSGGQPTQGGWGSIGSIILGDRLPGVYDVAVTNDTRGVPESQTPPAPENIIRIALTVLPPATIHRAMAAAVLDYQPISGQLANALPGQKIHLRLALPQGVQATDVQWTLPGTSFKNYTANRDTGTLVQMAQADLSVTDVNFYWADGGAKTVTVRFKTFGVQRQISAGITVLSPTATLTTTMGTPKFGFDEVSGTIAVGLFADEGQQAGITFTGNVVNPSGYEGGGWHWVQTIVSSATIVDHEGIRRRLRINGQLALDSTYPYEPDRPDYPNGYYPVGEGHTDRDSPRESLFTLVPLPGNPANAVARKKVAFENESFAMYLMYLPPGLDSRFVPLKCVQWSFSVSATNLDPIPQWSIDTNSVAKNVTAAADCNVHPQWNKNVADYIRKTLEFWDPY